MSDEVYPDLSKHSHIKPYQENGNSRISRSKNTDMVEWLPWLLDDYSLLDLSYFYYKEVGIDRDTFGSLYFTENMNDIVIVKYESIDGKVSWNSGENYKIIVSKKNRPDAIKFVNETLKFNLDSSRK